tara:strand:+ start:190 stop:453 length:264 start_codon:yes stop_codon:yes gene_type:complete
MKYIIGFCLAVSIMFGSSSANAHYECQPVRDFANATVCASAQIIKNTVSMPVNVFKKVKAERPLRSMFAKKPVRSRLAKFTKRSCCK